jgi:phosphate transport system substrate-binding protein
MALHPTRRSILAGVTLAGLLPVAPGLAQEVTGRAPVVGAGSTFAYPVVARWAKGYHRWVAGGGIIPIAGGGLDDPPSGAMLDYEPTGSLAGVMRVRERAVDFGASEMPLKSEELRKLGLVQFPLLIGGIVAVVNVDGVGPGQLKLTGQALADIYLGRVQNWSDPSLKALNPLIALPDAKIVVVRRSDGSGTTFNFTDFLSKASPLWKTKVGSDLLVSWPEGTVGAKGNDGVSRAVRQSRNSIGYVEFAHAQQNKLAYALIRNPAGNFVVPSPQTFQAAASSADWKKAGDFELLLTDMPGADAYPVVATVFVLMSKDMSAQRRTAALNFFDWSLTQGSTDAASLGYVPLPPDLVSAVKAYWADTLVSPAR